MDNEKVTTGSLSTLQEAVITANVHLVKAMQDLNEYLTGLNNSFLRKRLYPSNKQTGRDDDRHARNQYLSMIRKYRPYIPHSRMFWSAQRERVCGPRKMVKRNKVSKEGSKWPR